LGPTFETLTVFDLRQISAASGRLAVGENLTDIDLVE